MYTMTQSTHSSSNGGTYPLDAENAAEMARLLSQDRLVTKMMGGLFSERADFSAIRDVLDVGCGPGGWVLDVARAYPDVNVTGIDISQLMTEYARTQARTHRLQNASFKVMDILKPLDFPDNSFDLVNARTIAVFMPATAWPSLIQECVRVNRPGGTIRLTECDLWGSTNSLAYERFIALCAQASKLAGRGFSLTGRDFGVTPMLGRLLRDAGCTNIGRKAHANDFSAGTEAHAAMYQDAMVFYKLVQPFLVKTGVATQEEVNLLYQQTLEEMRSDDFCALAYFLTVWGETPR
jgi:ubiquinone/menaquinone biosynthesis C-methylase UbiE